jgi:hypothetical protein
MFNAGGEIEIFNQTGLTPVFFGEALVGTRLPNLTYMLTFDNMEARDRNWKQFGSHPDWVKLKDQPEYVDTGFQDHQHLPGAGGVFAGVNMVGTNVRDEKPPTKPSIPGQALFG